jgi:hypothetical protein
VTESPPGAAGGTCGYGRRWMVEPIGGGTYRHAPGEGWAIVVDAVG